MKVTLLKECGYEEAVYGFSLSYNSTIERTKQILPKYAFGRSGERKFLESIYVWLDVTAPRFIWSEADTYRISTKQSESTMHTLHKRPLIMEDFEYELPENMLDIVNRQRIKFLNKEITKGKFKSCLPDGYLQTREWCFNYGILQNIYNQRHDHELEEWHYFLDVILKNIEHPEFIVNPNEKE